MVGIRTFLERAGRASYGGNGEGERGSGEGGTEMGGVPGGAFLPVCACAQGSPRMSAVSRLGVWLHVTSARDLDTVLILVFN